MAWIQTELHSITESIILGCWLVLIPSVFLVLVSSVASLEAATMRRAWLGCLIAGLFGIGLGLFGLRPAGGGWTLPWPEMGDQAFGGVFVIYLIGVFWILGRALLGWWALQRWTASARPVHERRVVDAFEVAKAALENRGPCYLLAGRAVPTPITVGLINHRVLLPADLLEELDEAELRDLALHEMAHVRRRDPAAFALAVLATALFWPNPLVWLAVHQLKLNAEKLADESVVSVTEEVKPYSRLLLKMSERTTRGAMVPLAAGVYLHKSFFIQRAEALVAGMFTGRSADRSSIPAWFGLGAGLAGALVFLPALPEPDGVRWEEALRGRTAGGAGADEKTASGIIASADPVDRLLRDGLFFEDTWVRFNPATAPSQLNEYTLEQGWLTPLGVESTPRFMAYRHLYHDAGGKQSFFCFEQNSGTRLFIGLDRIEGASFPIEPGLWRLGRGAFEPGAMALVEPGSIEEQAIIQLLTSWSLAAAGGENAWQGMLREWPDLAPGTAGDAALIMGEALETFRELRIYPE